MATVDVYVDGAIFSDEVVARTAHRYTNEYFVEVESSPSWPLVRLTPKGAETDTTQLTERFRNDALDERLRERGRSETSELQTVLVRAALQQATPKAPGQGQ
jgi:His-Xaa-Ser system protein HxsD